MININELPTLNFNTRCPYTEHGQRIGAVSIDGGVFINDIDRRIWTFFPECPMDRTAIMEKYHSSPRTSYPPSIVSDDYRQHQELCGFAEAAALKL